MNRHQELQRVARAADRAVLVLAVVFVLLLLAFGAVRLLLAQARLRSTTPL